MLVNVLNYLSFHLLISLIEIFLRNLHIFLFGDLFVGDDEKDVAQVVGGGDLLDALFGRNSAGEVEVSYDGDVDAFLEFAQVGDQSVIRVEAVVGGDFHAHGLAGVVVDEGVAGLELSGVFADGGADVAFRCLLVEEIFLLVVESKLAPYLIRVSLAAGERSNIGV